MPLAACARTYSAVRSSGGSSANAKTPLLITGTSSAVPLGTVHVRVIGSPPKLPARNQTCPCWPSAHELPVSSRTGFVAVGWVSAHCHHLAAHSLYECPYGTLLGDN